MTEIVLNVNGFVFNITEFDDNDYDSSGMAYMTVYDCLLFPNTCPRNYVTSIALAEYSYPGQSHLIGISSRTWTRFNCSQALLRKCNPGRLRKKAIQLIAVQCS